ncbi:MAG: site-2 protease family protein [Nocardioidaceae bacterium]
MKPESDPSQAPAGGRPSGTIKIGTIAGIDVLVRASWFILALIIAVLMAPAIDSVRPGLGPLKYLAGVAFAVLLYLSVLLHEISHALVARAFGMEVCAIQLDFLGGVTQIGSASKTAWQEFAIAVVGPLTSIAIGVLALAGAFLAPDGLILLALQAMAGANLLVGILNLVPGLPLDGGRVLRAMVWGGLRDQHLGTVVAAWGGRIAAVLTLVAVFVLQILGLRVSLVDVLMAGIIAAFLWSGASASLMDARLRRRLPALSARKLARRTIAVPQDLSVGEAVRRARADQAGAIVLQSGDGQISGIVNEASLAAVPEERRAWISVANVSRSFDQSLVLSADLVGEDLIKSISQSPATDYLLIEPDGSIYGVLNIEDVDRVFAVMMKGKA